MNQFKRTILLVMSLAMFVLAVGIGCDSAVDEAEPTASTESTEIDVPVEVAIVRESALDHLRTIAQVCVPPANVPWQASTNDDFIATGTSIYLFSAEDCVLNISYPSPANEETLFYAALRNSTMDFCWQGFIDAEGHIQSTGYDVVEPGLVNPSAVYCEEQGYLFEVRTRDDGKQCGACVFSEAEDDVCNAWDYFYGNCEPAE